MNPDFGWTLLMDESRYEDRPVSLSHSYALLTMTVLEGFQSYGVDGYLHVCCLICHDVVKRTATASITPSFIDMVRV